MGLRNVSMATNTKLNVEHMSRLVCITGLLLTPGLWVAVAAQPIAVLTETSRE